MLTKRRIIRAVTGRADRALIRVANRAYPHHGLKCRACGKTTLAYFIYEGYPEGCPNCHSFGRERFVQLALDHGLIALPGAGTRIAHVAPSELSLYARFRENRNYIAGDLIPGIYRDVPLHALDLTLIDQNPQFANLDLLYASHVLEHIPDEQKALKAIFRALKPGGQAWFLVPMRDGETIEDAGSLPPLEREQRFGQWDHVRLYGNDTAARLKRANFDVDVVDVARLPPEEVWKNGIWSGEKIFVCRRPAN